MADRSLVKNAADPEQVEAAAEKEADRDMVELNDLRGILRTESGRRFLYRLAIEKCGAMSSVWNYDKILQDKDAARQHVGLELIAEITVADKEAWPLILREARIREER